MQLCVAQLDAGVSGKERWTAVTTSERGRTDEEFACGVVIDYLTNQGESEFKCEVNTNDPPDLVITWNDGTQWGVEVTRTYQKVANGRNTRLIASAGMTEPLWRFVEELEEATRSARTRNYVLSVGPDPIDVFRGTVPAFDRQWRRRTGEKIRQHIAASKMDTLRCPGAYLRPGDPGSRWTPMISAGVAEIGSATETMLEAALVDKTTDLVTWHGNFVERWLLLLNCYPLANDQSEVRRVVSDLFGYNQHLCQFDGVYWSGYPDRRLVAIRRPTS